MLQVIRVPFDGQQIGQGYNSKTAESIGTALSWSPPAPGPTSGQAVTSRFDQVSTQESLVEALGISASIDARYGLFSGDAKFNFANSNSVNSYSTFVAGSCQVQNAWYLGQDFKLTAAAEAILHQPGGDKLFRTAFGNMFVRALRTGGEFNVVSSINSISEEHQSKISASLHAAFNGLVTAADFKATFERALQETSGRTSVSVFMYQAGGVGKDLKFTGSDATKVLEKLDQLPAIAHRAPIGFEAEIANYNTIPIVFPTEEETEDLKLVLDDCYSQKKRLLQFIADVDLAMSDDGRLIFDNLPSTAELAQMRENYRASLNKLMAHAIKVAKGEMQPPAVYVANPPDVPPVFTRSQFTPSVRRGYARVPDLTGLDFFGASAVCEKSGLTLALANSGASYKLFKDGSVTPFSSGWFNYGVVQAQSPLPGANVLQGSTVKVTMTTD
ncbi:MAG: hypothetical protein EOQ50_26610 [Mesorhizobium sp.]|uniref:PASTA domain-containing protein n=1 Tax=Mesorhizobium sp. TaxID=1871066 RepID=UPI000FE7E807|nr:PASTA domain-containing protein [Mesorhizobium sp.]RWB69599.1 MAG: hypothetical protein EOQ50_26610 [Mesorhizobium sp.]RWM00591.1 MAG: hypothetical protein EOR68_11740 [Mesorhizobium sp.]TIP51195.1 MAG: hypothetical protein E5X77_02880 [Mesorhizobium sp.]